ncbi:MAG: ECF transporter S component [Bacillota bacterium]|nr:ECF transporter S component [Bacillota bacterium]
MKNTKTLVMYALFTAIIVLMSFTPLGYLKTAFLEISFIMIPVAIGAVLMGPGAGAFFGTVFGITSFIQCFGLSQFGSVLLSINPFYTAILCLVPRILMGWLTGLIFKGLYKVDKTKMASFAVANLSGALLNTIFFMLFLILLFGNTKTIMDARGNMNIFAFVIAFVGTNGLIEAGVSFVVGTAVSKALFKSTRFQD